MRAFQPDARLVFDPAKAGQVAPYTPEKVLMSFYAQ
jgi:hypothetical protein